jgi:hypothetical protein
VEIRALPELPQVSPNGDLAKIKFDYSIIIEVKILTKIANPHAFTVE